MDSKITKPKVIGEIRNVAFEDVYDETDPYIERVIIQDCSIDTIAAESVEFIEVIFRNVRFEQVSISKMYLRDVIFEKCDLSNVQFEEATLQRVVFENCQMTGINLSDGRLENVSFLQCNLQFAMFGYNKQKLVAYQDCLLKQTDMYENVLNKVKFETCELTGINFSHTALNGIDLSNSVFDQMTVGINNLKGCIVNQEQAQALSLLLGLVVKENEEINLSH
mgnify:CR=1 FL=1